MPLQTASARDAWDTLRRNKASMWYPGPKQKGPLDSRYAGVRLSQQGFFAPVLNAAFQFSRRDSVFTIGSCFARNLEARLLQQNIQVPSFTSAFDAFEANPHSHDGAQRNFPSKFNTFSIQQQMAWGLDPATPFPREALVDLGDGRFADPHGHVCLTFADLDTTMARRRALDGLAATASACPVIIITLGLNEVWRDRVTGLYANFTPTPDMRRANPDRFEFVIPTFSENLAALEATHELFARRLPPGHQVIVTVSPVALDVTFSPMDIVLANWRSKSLLLAVATTWAQAHDNVHYFPSFEIVYHSDPARSWQEDRRHPTGSIIAHIMSVFFRHYLREDAEGGDRADAPVVALGLTPATGLPHDAVPGPEQELRA